MVEVNLNYIQYLSGLEYYHLTFNGELYEYGYATGCDQQDVIAYIKDFKLIEFNT